MPRICCCCEDPLTCDCDLSDGDLAMDELQMEQFELEADALIFAHSDPFTPLYEAA